MSLLHLARKNSVQNDFLTQSHTVHNCFTSFFHIMIVIFPIKFFISFFCISTWIHHNIPYWFHFSTFSLHVLTCKKKFCQITSAKTR